MNRLTLTAVVATFAISAAFGAPRAHAAVMNTLVYQDDFATTTVGQRPDGWDTVVSNGGPSWAVNASGEYRWTPDGTNQGSLTTFQGTLNSGQNATTLTDYRVLSNIRQSSSGISSGVVARYTDADNFYHLRLDSSNNLQLLKWVGGNATVLGTNTAGAGQTGLLELILDGDSIIGRRYALGTDPDTATPLATISVTDTSLTTGTFGLRGFGSDGTSAVSEDFLVFTIPTPAALPAGLGLLALIGLRRRRSV